MPVFLKYKAAFVIPAYNAGALLEPVVRELLHLREQHELSSVPVLIVDDGSTDQTGSVAAEFGVELLSHSANRGKGEALKSALHWAHERGLDCIVTLDADGQHPPAEAIALLTHDAPHDALVLSVRDMAGAGAPRPNQLSNRFSNWVLSMMGGEKLLDTQCGLRRYPVEGTLKLASPASGYAYESDLVLRAARRGLSLHFVPARVIYPPETERVTYFDSVRDPARIVGRVLCTTLTVPHHRMFRRWVPRLGVAWGLAWALSFAL